jgi:hypothetical protein
MEYLIKLKFNLFRWLCWPIDLAALFILVYSGINFWSACLLIFTPALFNYLDGLYRGYKYGK